MNNFFETNKVSLNAQSSVKIVSKDIVIYFDPFKIEDEYNDADYIFISHPHYDHFSPDDIEKIRNSKSKIIVPIELENDVKKIGFSDQNILLVSPNDEYILDELKFETVVAYNENKSFHKKEYNWVGYLININDKKIYFAGDTDNVPEIRTISCDIAFIPIGGTYTMNVDEAIALIKDINPSITVPIHYKTIVGTADDAYLFKEKLKEISDVKIIMK